MEFRSVFFSHTCLLLPLPAICSHRQSWAWGGRGRCQTRSACGYAATKRLAGASRCMSALN